MHYALKQTTTKHGALSLKTKRESLCSSSLLLLAKLFFYKNSDSVSNSNSNSDSNCLYHSRTVQEHKEIVNQNSLYLTCLRKATGEVEALRQENNHLHVVNRELNKQLNLLIHALLRSSTTSNDFTIAASFSALNAAFRRLRIRGVRGGMNERSDHDHDHDHDQIPWDDVAAVLDLIKSPTSVIKSGRLQDANVEPSVKDDHRIWWSWEKWTFIWLRMKTEEGDLPCFLSLFFFPFFLSAFFFIFF